VGVDAVDAHGCKSADARQKEQHAMDSTDDGDTNQQGQDSLGAL
jgi:hypothetical protein